MKSSSSLSQLRFHPSCVLLCLSLFGISSVSLTSKMCNRMWMVAAVGLVMGITSVTAAIPGPNDPRYPDYIVNPPVTCTEEGSFPHPRNCSWYYRCVDRMKVGFFWTYHFECEPGTVFSDELDQCIHPFSAPYTCPPATTPGPPLKCEGVPGTCQTYDVCHPSKVEKTMCTEIRCPLRTPNLSCGDGYAFDMATQECALIPTDAELCSKPPVLPCEGVPGTCVTYDVCLPEKETLLFCKEIRCPIRLPNLSCGEGYSFDMKAQQCAKPPADSDLCGVDISVTDVGLLPCAYNGHIPKADFVIRQYCENIPLCDGDIYQGKTQLCDGYYECEKTADGWKAHERSCPAGFLFSFDTLKCEQSPSDEERC